MVSKKNNDLSYDYIYENLHGTISSSESESEDNITNRSKYEFNEEQIGNFKFLKQPKKKNRNDAKYLEIEKDLA